MPLLRRQLVKGSLLSTAGGSFSKAMAGLISPQTKMTPSTSVGQPSALLSCRMVARCEANRYRFAKRRCVSTTTRDATITVTAGPSSSSAATATASSMQAMAQEADRLTQVASSRRPKPLPRNTGVAVAASVTSDDYEAALQAANELLRIAHASFDDTADASGPPDNALTTSLHRSLLTVISWCVNLILQRHGDTGTAPPRDGVRVADDIKEDDLLWRTTLQLARRAHELRLPLHLPLYQQLAQAAAAVAHCPDALVRDAFEVSAWVVQTLHRPVTDAALFGPALRRLVRGHDFAEAAHLLRQMRYLYDLQYLPVELTSELLALLRDDLSGLSDRDTARDMQVLQFVALLEPSIHYLVLQHKTDALEASLRAEMSDLFKGMDAAQVGHILEAFETYFDSESDNDGDLESSDNDDEEEEDENEDVENGGLRHTARQRLSEFLHRNVAAKAPSSQLSQTQEAESDESVGGQDHEYLYIRERGDPGSDFPDVTEQFVRLNHGSPILFSAEYETILVQTDFEDLDLFEEFMNRSDSDSEFDEDDDDNGDDF